MKPGPSNVEARDRAWPLVPALYPEESEGFSARKGRWRIFERQRPPIPPFLDESDTVPPQPGFCAVYLREGRPKTSVVGATRDRRLVEQTVNLISRKVLEQRPFASAPARSLTAENGLVFGLRIGLLIMFFVGLFLIFDLILLPRFGPEVARGLSTAFSTELAIEAYTSRVGTLVAALFGPEGYTVITSMYSLAALILVPILIIGIVFEVSGKRADRSRVKDLGEPARDFLYGSEAWQDLVRQSERQKEEQAKQILYDRCVTLEMKATRREFSELFDEMKQLIAPDDPDASV
jgi:hypothetical protein